MSPAGGAAMSATAAHRRMRYGWRIASDTGGTRQSCTLHEPTRGSTGPHNLATCTHSPDMHRIISQGTHSGAESHPRKEDACGCAVSGLRLPVCAQAQAARVSRRRSPVRAFVSCQPYVVLS